MTEPSMVEKMARGAYEKFIETVRDLEPSWDGLPQSHRDRMIDSQRAAIEVLREPTDAMIVAASGTGLCPSGVADIYIDMIDAALRDGNERGMSDAS